MSYPTPQDARALPAQRDSDMPGAGEATGPATIGTAVAETNRALDPRTGEPRRPVVVTAATIVIYAGVAAVVAGLLWTFWWSISDFATAAWVHGLFTTEPGDLLRVGLVSAEFALVLLIGTLGLITGYYAWWGYGWTRGWGIAAGIVSVSAWALNPIAGAGSVAILLGVGLLWLPAARAFDQRWFARRHPAAAVPDRRDRVVYGPLPRYR